MPASVTKATYVYVRVYVQPVYAFDSGFSEVASLTSF